MILRVAMLLHLAMLLLLAMPLRLVILLPRAMHLQLHMFPLLPPLLLRHLVPQWLLLLPLRLRWFKVIPFLLPQLCPQFPLYSLVMR